MVLLSFNSVKIEIKELIQKIVFDYEIFINGFVSRRFSV